MIIPSQSEVESIRTVNEAIDILEADTLFQREKPADYMWSIKELVAAQKKYIVRLMNALS